MTYRWMLVSMTLAFLLLVSPVLMILGAHDQAMAIAAMRHKQMCDALAEPDPDCPGSEVSGRGKP